MKQSDKILFYTMLCYAILCYAMLYYTTYKLKFPQKKYMYMYFSVMFMTFIESIPSAQSSSGTGYYKLDYLHFPLTILDHHQKILLDTV